MEAVEGQLYQETSDQFVGQWNRLISTTNWEKGRIIQQWRQALIESGAPVQEYSDETWSRHVGNVSPQHVGRLRRVWERFAEAREEYEGLYWSHFQAALDWEDAEMWLEGALQNRLSVAQMRALRSETLGGLESDPNANGELLSSELDEDAEPIDDSTISASVGVVHAPGENGEAESWDESEEDEGHAEAPWDEPQSSHQSGEAATEPAARVRPFESLPSLPEDLSDAVEQVKLAILRHKLTGWDEVACDDVLRTLEALKELALAPSED